MEEPQHKPSFAEVVKNYFPAIALAAGIFVNLVISWKQISDNQAAVKDLREQVIRQYSTQRDVNEKMDAEIDKLKLEDAYQRGYQQAEKDLKK